MRKHFSFVSKFAALAATALVAFGCDNGGDDNGGGNPDPGTNPVAPAKVVDATATAGVQKVTVKFKAPTDTNWQYAEITYLDLKENKDKTEAVDVAPDADGFYAVEYSGYAGDGTVYNFDIVSVGKPVNGNRLKSEAVRVTATPLPIPPGVVDDVAETLAIEPCALGGYLSWTHTTGEDIVIRVSYKDPKNAEQTVNIDWDANESGSFRVGSMPIDNNDLKVQVVMKDSDGKDADLSDEVTFPDFTPLAAERFTNPNNTANGGVDLRDWWEVKAQSPMMNGTFPNAGIEHGEGARNILHGDYALTAPNFYQRWHSKTGLTAADVPVEAVFDMKEPRAVAMVEHFNSGGGSAAPSSIEFLFCDELDANDPMGASAWVSAGIVTHDNTILADGQLDYLQMRKPARYMKVSLLGTSLNLNDPGQNNNTHIEMGIINFSGDTPSAE